MVLTADTHSGHVKYPFAEWYSRFLPGPSVGLVLAAILAGPAAAQDARITVEGQGEVRVAPDMAMIQMGVSQDAPTAAEAVDAMSDDLSSVLQALRDAGVADSDVQTSALRLDVTQTYDPETGSATVTGYRALSDVSVRVLDLDALGGLLDMVVQDGANRLNGVQFNVIDRAPHLNQARRDAVIAARAKADVYAQAAGVELGPLTLLTESDTGAPQPQMMRMAMEDATAVPVATGDIDITARVTMTWELLSGTDAD